MARRTPRDFMVLAIEAMKQSVAEARADGKTSPHVGAVLVKPDGTVESAARGELRHGDHAEYTLIERKNFGVKLEGSALYTTLEPCAPGSRAHNKLGCAERIVLARVAEVWVGIEDPDPTVDRKGIQYLEDAGIEVHMFDRDLQDAIRDFNESFLAGAEARALAARERKPAEPKILSNLESALLAADLRDLDPRALDAFRRAAGISDAAQTDELHRHLLALGLLTESDIRLVPTGFALVLFGKQPRFRLPQAGLLGTVHLPDGREEARDFDGPAVFAPDAAVQWIQDKLPNPIDRSQVRRRGANAALHELMREGIVNALVHRDYGIEGAKCQLVARPDRIEILSPGKPVSPITIEQLQAFEAPMLSRNPTLHFVFAKLDLAEERGLGLKSMRVRASSAGLPPPTYAWRDPYIVLTLYTSASGIVEATSPALLAELSAAERSGFEWATTKESFSKSEYQGALGVPSRTAQNHLKRMTDLGLLLKFGSGPATRYRMVRS